MTFDEWLGDKHLGSMELEFSKDAFVAGAASRDAEVAELVAALEGYVNAINVSAKAQMSYQNASENFSDANDERKAAMVALLAASKAEGVARAVLAKTRKP